MQWGLSRLDLFCDVQGWELSGDDRRRFVCRAQRRDLHEEGEAFTGFEFGRRNTKTVCARIYDKTRQIKAKGLDYWYDLWGPAFDRARPVLRVEFELGRQGLVEFGARTPEDGIDQAGAMWASITSYWLSYRSPTADETRSRWPVAPQWAAVQRVTLNDATLPVERVRAASRQGQLRILMPVFVGYLARIGALSHATDATSAFAAARLLVARDEYRRGVPFADRLAAAAASEARR